jgi:ABC-type polysaccharide/polyol phosphate export permease
LHREAAYQVYYKLQHFYKNNPLRDLLQKYTKDIIGKDQALFENLFCYLISAVTAIIALIFHVLVVRDVTAPKNTI